MYEAKIRVSIRREVDELMFEMEILTGFALLELYIVEPRPLMPTDSICAGNACRGDVHGFVRAVGMLHRGQPA